ncbi:hypothetical protein DUNSADRAFT_8851 [Dunaliella salina]|uniref:Uncharacterized protein n=1 Tax=Dunaliella salina TaxID=3046 RepID=A0ABQ7H5N1_DUNSA|nr:hypothetical protein DUNSADRAFT_8851 [Dunaliella salina]|eukprot:KAF5842164.1 hypothetical protein DUNSADRAFT_8851 [Dunaliella salina]
MPLEWRCNVTRLALAGSFSGNICQYLGSGSGFHNLRELVLLAVTEEERTDWLAFYAALECSHLKAITLALCPDMGPLHLYSLASHSPNLEEMRVMRCPKVTRQQCQQLVRLLSKPIAGIFSPAETLCEDGSVYAAQQQAAEVAQIVGIEALDYTEPMWRHLHCRITGSTSARLRAVPFDIVCRDAGSEDALLHEEEGGRHLLASHAWRAVSNHTYYKSSA